MYLFFALDVKMECNIKRIVSTGCFRLRQKNSAREKLLNGDLSSKIQLFNFVSANIDVCLEKKGKWKKFLKFFQWEKSNEISQNVAIIGQQSRQLSKLCKQKKN